MEAASVLFLFFGGFFGFRGASVQHDGLLMNEDKGDIM